MWKLQVPILHFHLRFVPMDPLYRDSFGTRMFHFLLYVICILALIFSVFDCLMFFSPICYQNCKLFSSFAYETSFCCLL
uniref:Uncharacterized protein n=1 Tax=Rhizophora mucronata TaxID=61149 RepID=A0A2P2M919_RHIMU